MSRVVRLINGKGDWTDTPPTGASDADLYQLANDFVVQGGVADLEGGDSLVSELDSPDLGVKVAKGTMYVPNSTWEQNSFEPKYYQVVADAEEELEISSNSSGDTRIDLIAQQIDKITTPNDDASNVSPLVVIEGTPGEGAPDLPDDHLLLATVTVEDGATEILNVDIEDNRTQVYLETKDINEGFEEVADGTIITFDLATRKRKFFVNPIAGNRTIVIANAKEGNTIYVKFTNDGTSRRPIWPANITWYGIEDDPNMDDHVEANKSAAFIFVCTDEDTPAFDGFFLGAVE